jgi:hypothetical protein
MSKPIDLVELQKAEQAVIQAAVAFSCEPYRIDLHRILDDAVDAYKELTKE